MTDQKKKVEEKNPLLIKEKYIKDVEKEIVDLIIGIMKPEEKRYVLQLQNNLLIKRHELVIDIIRSGISILYQQSESIKEQNETIFQYLIKTQNNETEKDKNQEELY